MISHIRAIALAFAVWAACVTSPTVALAQAYASAGADTPPGGVSRYGTVFDQWVAKRGPQRAILVVRRGGRTVFAKGVGTDPTQPTMVASLSKPITGACVATLIRDGKVSFTTRLREGLSRFFRRYGAPADRRLEAVTVEQLLVHRSGLMGNGDDDPIYGVMNKRAYTGKGYLGAIQAVLSEYLVKLHLIRSPGTKYAYSNTGYEVLSAMIEERTGQSYEDYCREAVFAKLGIAAPHLHPDWRMLSGAGGWYVPGPDYLAFLDIFSPSHPFLSDSVKSWIDRAQTKWSPGNTDRWYALGVNTWAGSGRWTVSHGGVLNSDGMAHDRGLGRTALRRHAVRVKDPTVRHRPAA